jgi:isoquinoline 1-oxidoreductase subunit beta
VAGVPLDHVELYVTLLGGGFGRRLEVDYVAQAVRVAMDMPGVAVQLIWPREEDMRHDFYRPMQVARLRATVDAAGTPVALHVRSAGDAISPRWMERGLPQLAGPMDLPDKTASEGLFDQPYGFAQQRIEHVFAHTGVPVGFWRSVGHSHNAFFTESFIDELAHAAGVEPLSFRMSLLGTNGRLARCLQGAARLAQWDGGRAGSTMGIAGCSAYGSHIGLVATASVADDQHVKVHRLVAAVDCGRVVNTSVAAQQIEGGLIWALAQATIAAPEWIAEMPRARPFGSMGLPRLADAPEIVVEIIPSSDAPGGMSGLGTTVLAPAVANAIHAGSGRRMRNLPFEIA